MLFSNFTSIICAEWVVTQKKQEHLGQYYQSTESATDETGQYFKLVVYAIHVNLFFFPYEIVLKLAIADVE